MKIELSMLTSNIYAVSGKNKTDVTDECINAVLIRMIEGHKDNICVVKKSDGKSYELSIKELDRALG